MNEIIKFLFNGYCSKKKKNIRFIINIFIEFLIGIIRGYLYTTIPFFVLIYYK